MAHRNSNTRGRAIFSPKVSSTVNGQRHVLIHRCKRQLDSNSQVLCDPRKRYRCEDLYTAKNTKQHRHGWAWCWCLSLIQVRMLPTLLNLPTALRLFLMI